MLGDLIITGLSLGGCQGAISVIIRSVGVRERKITFWNLKDLSDLSGFLAFNANKYHQTLFKMLLGLCSNLSLTQILSGERFLGKSGPFGALLICKMWGIYEKTKFIQRIFLVWNPPFFYTRSLRLKKWFLAGARWVSIRFIFFCRTLLIINRILRDQNPLVIRAVTKNPTI